MTEGRPRPNRVRVKLHEANCAPEYVQAYLADEMDEYLYMLRAESAPAPSEEVKNALEQFRWLIHEIGSAPGLACTYDTLTTAYAVIDEALTQLAALDGSGKA